MKKILAFFILIVATDISLKMYCNNCFVRSNKELGNLVKQRDLLLSENSDLKQNSAYLSSLSYIKSEASQKNLVSLKMEYFDSEPFAMR